ncbi:hypothetical protein BS78_10G222000 [Paspalum vaginatum]|nr:hypothetical protein BS78_10G222000 [Paspalum vaginatum]
MRAQTDERRPADLSELSTCRDLPCSPSAGWPAPCSDQIQSFTMEDAYLDLNKAAHSVQLLRINGFTATKHSANRPSRACSVGGHTWRSELLHPDSWITFRATLVSRFKSYVPASFSCYLLDPISLERVPHKERTVSFQFTQTSHVDIPLMQRSYLEGVAVPERRLLHRVMRHHGPALRKTHRSGGGGRRLAHGPVLRPAPAAQQAAADPRGRRHHVPRRRRVHPRAQVRARSAVAGLHGRAVRGHEGEGITVRRGPGDGGGGVQGHAPVRLHRHDARAGAAQGRAGDVHGAASS